MGERKDGDCVLMKEAKMFYKQVVVVTLNCVFTSKMGELHLNKTV